MWLRIILCAIALLQVSECLVNPCKKGLKSTQFFAHPEAADKYIQCSMFGQMFVFSCPPGLVWKQEKTACDLKSFVSIFSIPSTTTAQTPSSNIDSGSAPSARIVAPVVPQVTTPQVVPQVVPQTVVPQQVQQQTFEQTPMQPQVQQPKQVQQQPQQQQFQQPQQVQQPMQVQQQQQQQFQQPQQVQQPQQQQFKQPQQVQQPQQQQFKQPQQVQQPMQVQQQAPQQPQQLQQQQEIQSQQQEIQQLQQQLQQEQQQLQQQQMPTTGPSSTQFAPIATTVSSTTSTTTTTTTPVPVPLPTANQPVVTPVVSSPVSTPSVSGGRCDSVSVSGSVFNIVNGVYSKLPSSASIYRRSDNLQLPGLLVKTSDQQWCVTFSFSTVDFNTLTVPDVLSRCGAGLDCCMLISEPASTATAATTAEIDDPSTVWVANILENRGKQDASIKFTCETTVKACTKVPFCPPECQGTRDGCDICECNGVPFFKIQSSELSSFGGAQQQQTPVVQQQTPQMPQQVQQQMPQQVQQQMPQQVQQQVPQQVQQQMPQQVPQQVQQQIPQQQPQMQPQPSTQPNPVVAPPTMQPTTQPQRPVTKVVQPATMQPQIMQEEQFRPTFIQNPHQEQQQQQQLQLQQQELQTLNELDKTVHQSPATQANSVSQFASRVEAIEKQQLQNQVDQLNRLIASAKTPSQSVTRPMFPGQQPVDVNAQQQQKIVQSFAQPQPQQPLTDMNHFVNTIPVRQPTQQQQQQQTMQSGLTERQRQELLMQQRKQQDIIARQQQEQLVRQEQEQRMLQQQFKQLQQQKTPGITTLSSRKFAARLPQPMAHMSQIKVLALNATNNQTEIQPTQPIHFEQQQQMPVQPVPTPVVEASVAQPAPAVQPHQQHQQQQQQQQHPIIQPIQPTQQLIQPFQPIQQQPPQQPQQQVHTPIKPVMTVDQTAPTTTRMNSGVFADQQRQSPSSKQFNSPSLNKAIEFNRQNMHKTLFQPMIKSIPITKCNVVQCGKNMVCREIRDCPMCSPMCLPQDPTEVNMGHVITCDNIKCPVPFKCVKSTFDHSVKCEV